MSGMGYVSLPALFSLLVHWQLISSLLWDFLASTQDICCWFHLSLQCGTHQRNYSEIKKQMKNILENHLHIKDIVKHNREPRCWAETVWTLLTEWQCILHSVPPIQLYINMYVNMQKNYQKCMFHLHTNYADWVAQFVENKTSKR